MPDATRDMLMSEIMLFEPVMQQSFLKNMFVGKFHPIATIQHWSLIELFCKELREALP